MSRSDDEHGPLVDLGRERPQVPARARNLSPIVPRASIAGRALVAVVAIMTFLASISTETGAQSAPGLLVSRAVLTAAATQAEVAATTGDPAKRAQNARLAAAIRQRLRDGLDLRYLPRQHTPERE